MRGYEAGIHIDCYYLFEPLFSCLKNRENMTYFPGGLNEVKDLEVANDMSDT